MSQFTRRAPTRRAAIAGAAAGAAISVAPAGAAIKAAPGDMNLGNPQAPVHVVEYLSLTCSHCAAFHEQVFPAFKAKYIDTGRIYFTARELLTAPAQVAAAGFLMARCNGGTRYFQVVDQVLKSQPRWQGGNIKPLFLEIAKANGLTEAQFETCITDPAAQDALGKRVAYATGTDKVTGTPTFFVNGVLVPAGHVPSLAELDAAIAKALKTASSSKTGGRR